MLTETLGAQYSLASKTTHVFYFVVFPKVVFPEAELRIIGVGAWCVPVGGVGVTNRERVHLQQRQTRFGR